METRTNPSINVDEPVAITLLANALGNCSGRFVSWSQEGITIKADARLKTGSVVKLEIGDNLVIAEVRDCEAAGSEFSASLSLLEWIGKSELQRLMHAIATAKLIPVAAAA
jgi:hypothetical protein